jgi:TRAP-type uncharacterized transport system substrate-binding protein
MFCERLSVLTEKVFEALELADDQGSMSPGTSHSEHINQLDDATLSCQIRTTGWDLPSIANVKVVSSYKISMPDSIIDQLTSPLDLLQSGFSAQTHLSRAQTCRPSR